ncbi:23S rRNA (pseudouridine(1915)-N(3))-methyltransferase RlmH [Clostridium sp. MB40-C1]|uniref:23S rRNA (pseudouridine(1915)-N(3))-methyltransferase RlmH n=1 Tax=Clostridium sp. MB40-C1 TaxID=3070996 RepID=UPI0027DFA388|nr:23S rRNA (pseudouridine(1915)-N(3))-methyltransferase RlmH [Clostridium sp. MB40-C1]WMJ80151.1 23S rRNA (pseudouridine(1915)-N(3))-methyltransferase RlmH [Clostridium sp. MB40-C1]
MNITIMCVGKLKEKYLKKSVEEYTKKIRKFANINIIELEDEKTPDSASYKEEILIKEKEGSNILRYIKDDMYVIAMDLNGKRIASEEFGKVINNLKIRGINEVVFIIGGSLGLSKQVISRADYKVCFSKMTFPHQLFRVMLLEQIYRSLF